MADLFKRKTPERTEMEKEMEKMIKDAIRALKDKDEYLRPATAEFLGNVRDPRAVEPLIQALNDKSLEVQEKAAEALGKIGDARAVEPLIQVSRDFFAKLDPVPALVMIGKPAVGHLTQALMDKDKYVRDVRRDATYALGKIGDVKAVEPLIQVLKERDMIYPGIEDVDLRRSAAEALGEIKDARAIDPLTQALKDKEDYVQRAAREALEKIRTKKS